MPTSMTSADITKARFLVGPNKTPLAGPAEDYFTIAPLAEEPLHLAVMEATEEEFAAALASPTTMSCADDFGDIFIGTAIITDDDRLVAANHKGQRAVTRLNAEVAAKVRESL